jgi:hypothetical protein
LISGLYFINHNGCNPTPMTTLDATRNPCGVHARKAPMGSLVLPSMHTRLNGAPIQQHIDPLLSAPSVHRVGGDRANPLAAPLARVVLSPTLRDSCYLLDHGNQTARAARDPRRTVFSARAVEETFTLPPL